MSAGTDVSCAVRAGRDGAIVSVSVSPGSSKPGIGGLRGEALHVRLKSAPEKGKANAELVEVMSAALGEPRSAFEITSGASSKKKSLLVRGARPEEIADRIAILIKKE